MTKFLEKTNNTTITVLIAFSRTCTIDGKSYTEAGINGFPQSQTERKFDSDEFNFIIVADKFQKGFDQPKLCGLYICKKLHGKSGVQCITRTDRPLPGKKIFILDFENEYEEVEEFFSKFYQPTSLPTCHNINDLIAIHNALLEYQTLITDEKVNEYYSLFMEYQKNKTDSLKIQLTNNSKEMAKLFFQQPDDEQKVYLSLLKKYEKEYEFLSNIIVMPKDLRKWYYYIEPLMPFIIKKYNMYNSRTTERTVEEILNKKVTIKSIKQEKTHEQYAEKLEHNAVPEEPVIAYNNQDPINKEQLNKEDRKDTIAKIVEWWNKNNGCNITDEEKPMETSDKIIENVLNNAELKNIAQSCNNIKDFERPFYDAIREEAMNLWTANNEFINTLINDDDNSNIKMFFQYWIEEVYNKLNQ